eukprot:scaffold2829_cov119-Isochrysis_galbana.AAC.3
MNDLLYGGMEQLHCVFGVGNQAAPSSVRDTPQRVDQGIEEEELEAARRSMRAAAAALGSRATA